MDRGVVTDHDDFDALQAQESECFWPAPIIAEAHAKPGIHRIKRWEAQVTGLKVAFLEVLKWSLRFMFAVAR